MLVERRAWCVAAPAGRADRDSSAVRRQRRGEPRPLELLDHPGRDAVQGVAQQPEGERILDRRPGAFDSVDSRSVGRPGDPGEWPVGEGNLEDLAGLNIDVAQAYRRPSTPPFDQFGGDERISGGTRPFGGQIARHRLTVPQHAGDGRAIPRPRERCRPGKWIGRHEIVAGEPACECPFAIRDHQAVAIVPRRDERQPASIRRPARKVLEARAGGQRICASRCDLGNPDARRPPVLDQRVLLDAIGDQIPFRRDSQPGDPANRHLGFRRETHRRSPVCRAVSPTCIAVLGFTVKQ